MSKSKRKRFKELQLSKKLYSKNVMKGEFKKIGEGRHRVVYLTNKGNVIKIPLNDEGKAANWLEARRYKQSEYKEILARCKLLGDMLVMEYIEDFYEHFKRTGKKIKLPEWSRYIDNCQVGFNKNNELKVYDYAGV